MKKFYINICIFLLILFSCTNPFTVREAEQPQSTDNSDTFETPLSHEKVLTNLLYAMNQQNPVNYKKCFVNNDSQTSFIFRFIHDINIETGLLNWDVNKEGQYLENLVANDSLRSINLVFSNNIVYNNITTSIDSVSTEVDYILTVSFRSSTKVYQGQSTIKLVKDLVSLWYIYFWEDRPAINSAYKTWSFLKQEYQ